MAPQPNKNKEDVMRTDSSLPGLMGTAERILRRFRVFAFVVLIVPIAPLYALCLGTALTPGLLLYQLVSEWAVSNILLLAFAKGCAIGIGYIFFAITLVFVVPLVNFLLPFRVKPFRGTWYSISVIPWFYHNALVQLVRYTVLDLITPTPINILFYKMMGMKVGRNVVINTSKISDPALITVEDNVTIGGSATIFAHYGMKGYLIIGETVIKKGANIGLKASIMGDVVVGENVNVLPHTVVLPKSRLTADSEELAKTG